MTVCYRFEIRIASINYSEITCLLLRTDWTSCALHAWHDDLSASASFIRSWETIHLWVHFIKQFIWCWETLHRQMYLARCLETIYHQVHLVRCVWENISLPSAWSSVWGDSFLGVGNNLLSSTTIRSSQQKSSPLQHASIIIKPASWKISWEVLHAFLRG